MDYLNLNSVLPVAGTELAQSWDQLFWFLFVVNAILFAVVMGPIVYILIRYRAKNGRKPSKLAHNAPLEIIWTAIPTVIVMVIFAWGWILYKEMYYGPPANAMEVRVVAKSWGWTFQYPELDNRTTDNQLIVPVNTPIKLVMTSNTGDVLHSFFVPNFRVKKDLVPGLYTQTWFESHMVGRHIYFCTEYCGVGHSQMWGSVVVLSDEDYTNWKWGKEIDLPAWVGVGALQEELLKKRGEELASEDNPYAALSKVQTEPGTDLVQRGFELSRQKGCVACHSADGSTALAPTYKGLYGTEVVLNDGSVAIRDDNYIRESIVHPQAKIVKGYERLVMPPYPGYGISALEMNALIAYIKSLK